MRLLVWIFKCPIENQIPGLNLEKLFIPEHGHHFPIRIILSGRRGSSIYWSEQVGQFLKDPHLS